ncbi:MAG: PAS domain S-box protein, partial [Candidatus Zixiibacteriota bacterium]
MPQRVPEEQVVDEVRSPARIAETAEDCLRRFSAEIVRHVSEAIVLVSPEDRTILYANPACEELLGHEPNSLVGQQVTILSPSDGGFAGLAESVFDSLADNGQFNGELPAVRRDGSRLWCRVKVSAFDHPDFGSVWIGVGEDITDRKKTETVLRETEARHRRQLEELELVYRTTPVGLCLLDTDLRYLRINEQLAKINGTPASDHIGKRVVDVIPEIGRAIDNSLRGAISEGRAVQNVELRGVTPASPGVEKDWLANYYPLCDPDGKVYALSAVVLEITEQKSAERAISESEEKFRAFFDHAGVAMTVVDENKKIVQVNDAM